MSDSDELKMLAHLAKSRMKSGYWSRVKAQMNAAAAEGVTQAAPVGCSYSSFVKRELERGKKLDEREEQFRRKVEELLCSREEVSNPIGRLIDYGEYNKLDYAGKQRYILELSDKYRRVAATILTARTDRK